MHNVLGKKLKADTADEVDLYVLCLTFFALLTVSEKEDFYCVVTIISCISYGADHEGGCARKICGKYTRCVEFLFVEGIKYMLMDGNWMTKADDAVEPDD